MDQRIGTTLVLAVAVWIVLNLFAYVIFCGLVGPWGGALEGSDTSNVPHYTVYLSWALQVIFILGPLLIGWKWSRKFWCAT